MMKQHPGKFFCCGLVYKVFLRVAEPKTLKRVCGHAFHHQVCLKQLLLIFILFLERRIAKLHLQAALPA